MKFNIVEFWSKVFLLFKRLSFFELLNLIFPKINRNTLFVDSYVLGNLILSFVMLLICSLDKVRWWEFLVIGYACCRIFEVVIYQVNVLLFDEYRARKQGEIYKVRGFRRLVILLLHNYVEIIFWFGIFYSNLELSNETNISTINSFFHSFNLSFVTMTTFGSSSFSPNDSLSCFVIFIQSLIGLFMAILIFARFVSLLPNPKTNDEHEND